MPRRLRFFGSARPLFGTPRSQFGTPSAAQAVAQHHSTPDHPAAQAAYVRLGLMALLSFASMYVLMYAMVDRFANVYSNLNQAYMAGLMTAPMIVIELLLMRSMYPRRIVNAAAIGLSLAALAVLWFAIRHQTAVGDVQFLRSMIPHHGGAILMCEEAAITDPEVKALCEQIKRSQQAEIDLMKAKLRELEAR